MPEDILARVLTAATQRRVIFGGNPATSFSLIVHANLGPADAPKIRQIQSYVRERYGIEIPIVGGGSGCTRLRFECASTEELTKVLRAIAEDPALQSLIRELGGADFRVATPASPFSFDGRDVSDLRAIIGPHVTSTANAPYLLQLSDLVSKSRKLPPREAMLKLIVELRRELEKVILPDFDQISDLNDDLDVIHAAWKEDEARIANISARIDTVTAFKAACSGAYPTAFRLATDLCDVLRTLDRVTSAYAHV